MTDKKSSSRKFDENFIRTVREIQENLPLLKFDGKNEPSFEEFEKRIVSAEKLVELKQSLLLQDLRGLQFSNNYSLLCVSIPGECTFNGAIMVNNPFMGLMHSLVTKIHQWEILVPELKSSIDEIASLGAQLRDRAPEKLNQALKKLLKENPNSFIELKFLLINAQLKVLQYVQNLISKTTDFDEYDYIKVQDEKRNSYNMKLLFFKHNFSGEFETCQKRHHRVIKTIIFKPIDDLNFHKGKFDVFFHGLGLFYKEVHRTSNEVPSKLFEGTIYTSMEESRLTGVETNRNGRKYLNLSLPKEFTYTGAINISSYHVGLLHSALRQYDKWATFVLSLKKIQQRFEPDELMALDAIQDAIEPDSLLEAYNRLRHSSRNAETFLFEAVSKIAKFIQDNINLTNYLEEGVNYRDQIKTYFKVKDLNQKVHVMALNVSKELYKIVDSINDKRPIRELFTVYFISWDEYESTLSDTQKDEVIGEKKRSNIEFLKKQAKHSVEDDYYKGNFPDDRYKYDFITISDKDLKAAIKMDDNPIADHNEVISQGASLKKNWLHVRMPDEFGYTCAILTNDLVETQKRRAKGLLHSFARHWEQFEEHIPELKKLISKHLSRSIKELIENVAKSTNPKFYFLFSKALEDDESLHQSLFKAQLIIYNFIQENVKNYLCDGVYKSKNEMCWQVYFNIDNESIKQGDVTKVEVENPDDKEKTLLLGLSKEFYSSTEEHDAYPRILRAIITSYFISDSTYGEAKVVKLWNGQNYEAQL